MTRQQLAPYAMPVVYLFVVVAIVIGITFIAVRAIICESWR